MAGFVLGMLWNAVCFMCYSVCGFFLLGKGCWVPPVGWETWFLSSLADKLSFTHGKHKTIIMWTAPRGQFEFTPKLLIQMAHSPDLAFMGFSVPLYIAVSRAHFYAVVWAMLCRFLCRSLLSSDPQLQSRPFILSSALFHSYHFSLRKVYLFWLVCQKTYFKIFV